MHATTAVGPLSVCFVAHNAFGALAGVDTGHIGGIERQQSLMARWLAKRGHRVSMITWREGHDMGASVDGVGVYPLCLRSAGLPGLRFVHPRWSSLWRAMSRANAKVYYYNCGDLALGQVALWARLHRRKTVYSVASDPDCDPGLPTLRSRRERTLYRIGLRLTDAVVVQTRSQQQMLQAGFGLGSTLIAMPGCGFEETASPVDTAGRPHRILWVGRFSPEKRLEMLLDAAEACPEHVFDVVGAANADSPYARELQRRAASLANVVMHGRLVHRELGRLFRGARLLCCTSRYEGFPNTFLEAWSMGVPVVSTFDPDRIIRESGLGAAAGSFDELLAALRHLLSDDAARRTSSENAAAYYRRHHHVDAVMPLYEQTLVNAQEGV